MSQALLEVKNLKVYYPVKVRKNALASEKRFVKAAAANPPPARPSCGF